MGGPGVPLWSGGGVGRQDAADTVRGNPRSGCRYAASAVDELHSSRPKLLQQPGGLLSSVGWWTGSLVRVPSVGQTEPVEDDAEHRW